jgi:hypothetical protein
MTTRAQLTAKLSAIDGISRRNNVTRRKIILKGRFLVSDLNTAKRNLTNDECSVRALGCLAKGWF